MHMPLDRYRLGSLDRYADAYYQPQLVLRNAMEALRFDLLTLMHWLMYDILKMNCYTTENHILQEVSS